MSLRSSRRARSCVIALAAVLALAVAPLALSSPALATGHDGHGHHGHHGHGDHGHGHHSRFDYLALGDSVPFGYRPSGMVPTPNYADEDSFVGYPELYTARTRSHLTNASCAGESTDSFIDEAAQSNGCENSLGSEFGYRDLYPLHVDYQGSQLDYAVSYLRTHHRTRLVSLNIGANDLFLCQKTTTSGCTSSADFGALLQHVATNVKTILSTLRTEGRYHHRLVLVTYYSTNYSDAATTGAIAALNDATVAAAEPYHVRVADGFGAMQAAAASNGGDSCAAGLIIKLPDGTCDVHPTQAGHEVLADALQAAVGHRAGHRTGVATSRN